MSVNLGLAQVSGDFLVAAIVIYSLAVIGFAGDFAFGRPRRAKAAGAPPSPPASVPPSSRRWARPRARPGGERRRGC